MVKDRRQRFFESAAVFSAVATCFVLPFSSSLLSLFSLLTIFFWLFSGKVKDVAATVRSHPIALLATLLFLLFVAGMLYSSAEASAALSTLKKYRELIFIPLLITLLKDNTAARKNAEYSFISGCIILMLISYAMYFSILPSSRYGSSVVYHITHSYFMAILAFWSVHKALDSHQYKYFWVVVFLLSTFNLFYIAPGRTGMLVFLCLMLLFLMQRLSLLQQMIGIFLITLLLSLTFLTSENFASRSSLALREIQDYQYGSSRTSLGMRFDWWVTSMNLIKDRPLFGHGTGAFTEAHDEKIAGTRIEHTDNPHNEYLFIGVQLGAVGLALFLLLLLAQVKYSFKLERPDRFFLQGVVVAMAVGCLMNSFLFDSHQGHFWAFLSSIYFSAYPERHLSVSC